MPGHPATVPFVLHLRVIAPAELRDQVIEALTGNPGVAHLVVHPDAARDPQGDEITADIARESANDVIAALKALGTWGDHSGRDRHRLVDSGVSRRRACGR